MGAKNALVDKEKRIRDLRFFLVGMFFIVMWQAYSLTTAPDRITVHIPPDLERGAILNPGEVPKPNIYSFSLYVFQAINTWEEDGYVENPALLDVFRCYLTPEFNEYLTLIHTERSSRGETRNRKRSIREANQKGFDPSKVVPINESKWVVNLDMKVQETIDKTLIKDVSVRYPLIVIKDDSSPDCNPWGIKFAGYDSTPKRIITR